jgi:transcriptional regulator with XRE-family HTH domain
MRVTGGQIRAARALLNWTIADLTKAAGISSTTIRAVESDVEIAGMVKTLEHRKAARDESIAKLAQALEKEGITFLPATAQGPGVRGKA